MFEWSSLVWWPDGTLPRLLRGVFSGRGGSWTSIARRETNAWKETASDMELYSCQVPPLILNDFKLTKQRRNPPPSSQFIKWPRYISPHTHKSVKDHDPWGLEERWSVQLTHDWWPMSFGPVFNSQVTVWPMPSCRSFTSEQWHLFSPHLVLASSIYFLLYRYSL